MASFLSMAGMSDKSMETCMLSVMGYTCPRSWMRHPGRKICSQGCVSVVSAIWGTDAMVQ